MFNIRIADFGYAAPIEGRDGSGTLTTMRGTVSYMAPELFALEPIYHGQVVDLFSLGAILFILYSGFPAFGKANPSNDGLYSLIAKNRYDQFWAY